MQMGYMTVPLLNADTTGSSAPVDMQGFQNLTFYVTGEGTIDGGVITFSEAYFNPQAESNYSGTWSSIGTVNAADVTGGAQLAYHAGGAGGSFAYAQVKAEITSAVTGGGSVSVVLRAC